MAQCLHCQKKGLFLSIDKNGLCKSCLPIVMFTIKQILRVLEESINFAENGKTYKTRLSRCNDVLEKAQELRNFEDLGIPTIEPKPSELILEYTNYRDKLILEKAGGASSKATQK
ncbi:MAG: hypothetical protein IMF07_00875 [Proteobacteria bacterium]|nr:hypothetical protein [Pseudomonadota bacterium]